MMKEAPKAVSMFERVNNLLETGLKKILTNEQHNENRIHLYDVGEYWVAFEKSAYQLGHLNAKAEQPIVMYMKGHPFPIVMQSVYYTKVNDMCSRLPMAKRSLEYIQFLARPLDDRSYNKWYREFVLDED